MTDQPFRVRHVLPDGHGVVLGEVCALCEETLDGGIVCEVCDRVFCAEPCYGVHLIARDAADADADEVFAAQAAKAQVEPATRKRWHRRERKRP